MVGSRVAGQLREETYPKIGQYLKEAAQGYVEEWKASQKAGK